jgi:diguanylate cyclase (GGDEF)-like protein/PAS domain S-box-containing protein
LAASSHYSIFQWIMPESKKFKFLQQQIHQLTAENAELKRQKQLTEEKLNAALDGTGLCLWEQDIPSGNLIMYNQEWGELLGFSIEELPAHISSWKGHLHPEDKDWVITAFEDHVAGKTEIYQAVHRMVHKDGSIAWVSDRGRIISYTPDGKPLRIMGTHTDITQEKRYEQSLAKLAHYDPLTNLLNRAAIEKAYNKRLSDNHAHTSVCFIDLDGLKDTNDKYGHHLGDLLLVNVARTLEFHSQLFTASFRQIPQEIKLSRLGGDEFLILMPSHDKPLLTQFCQNLIDHYQDPINIDGRKISLGLSIGIYPCQTEDNFATACEMADTAMYFVKKRGKNNIAFWQQSLSLNSK